MKLVFSTNFPVPTFWESIYLRVRLSDIIPQATEVPCFAQVLNFSLFHFGLFSAVSTLLLIPFMKFSFLRAYFSEVLFGSFYTFHSPFHCVLVKILEQMGNSHFNVQIILF